MKILRIIILLTLFGCTSVKKIDSNKPVPNQAKMLFAGDVMMDWGIKDIIIKKDASYPLKKLKSFLLTFDYRFCNLESPISDTGEVHTDKKYVFLGKPRHLEMLKYADINCVSLANNHACDYSKTALLDTINNLREKGISTTGAGKDIKSAHLPVTAAINKLKIAIIAYTSIAYDDSFAGESSPGVANAKIDLISNDIKQLRDHYDFIIISVHWGDEYSEYPNEKQIELGHAIIDNGADVIIGHHPHIFQGVEIYRGKPIFYSLGNFIFGSLNEDIRDNILVEIIFLKNKIKSFSIFPINGNGSTSVPFQYELLHGRKALKSLNHLLYISKPLKSDFIKKASIKGYSLVYLFKK